MKTAFHDGFYFRVVPVEVEKDEEPKVELVPVVDFIHSYSQRNGQLAPTTTVCIIPRLDHPDDVFLTFGVGVAHCSEGDQPNKRVGRTIAESRARSSLDNGMSVRTKPYGIGDGKTSVVGMFIDVHEEYRVVDLQLPDKLMLRLRSSFRWLNQQLVATAIYE